MTSHLDPAQVEDSPEPVESTDMMVESPINDQSDIPRNRDADVSTTTSPQNRQPQQGLSQRWMVLLLACSLTTLLSGAAIASWWFSSQQSKQLADADFLRSRLESLGEVGAPAPPASPPALVRVALANRQAILPTRPLYGRLVEVRKVTVSSEVKGKLVEMPVEVGTLVEADKTLLAKVDDVWSKLAIDQINAEIRSIQAQLDGEKSELDRYIELAEHAAVSNSELENQESLVTQLQANLDKAKAMLAEEQLRSDRSSIVAPFDGTVIAKHAEVGQMLAAGTPVVEIVSRGTIDAEIRVPESLVDLIHVGLDIPIVIEPLQMEQRGRVVSIVPYGPTASRTFPVRLRLDDQGGRLKVGMSVQALVPEGDQIEELFVDKNAVLVRPDGCVAWVAVPGQPGSPAAGQAPDCHAQPVAVQIIARERNGYAIRPETPADGDILRPGVLLIVEGAERLSAGQAVQIVTIDPQHLEHLPEASGHQLID